LTTRLAFLCDFDGTVAPADVGRQFFERFASDRRAPLDDLEARWRSGELGHRELSEAQSALIRCGETDALAFVSGFALDPHFAPFVRVVRSRGHEVCVVSEGFDFYIGRLLEREGLADVAAYSNRLRFDGDRVSPEFPYAARSCGRCGNCKAAHVRDWRAKGYGTVLVGDGLSDRCAAREADVVIARDALLAWCASEGRAARAFSSFADVAALAPELEAA
jgi:2-hydroxy-3-keto-5-methylthiopentenyl-1-phosphate phosphatase